MSETLVIDRTKWYRGKGSPGSALLRTKDELMCCLGFCLLQRGFTSGELLDVGTPGEVVSVGQMKLDALSKVVGLVDLSEDESRTFESEVCDQLVIENDDPDIDDLTRERRIADLFAKIGVVATFVN